MPHPNHHTILTGHRQTGRTTRMIKAALAAAADGKSVYIAALNDDHAEDLRSRITSIAGTNRHHIKVETSATARNMNLPAMRMMRSHPDCLLLADHHTIESQFGPMLEMLHRFDTDATVKPLDPLSTN